MYLGMHKHLQKNRIHTYDYFWDIATSMILISLGMPDHTFLRWSNKFVTSMDPLSHKKQFYNSTYSWVGADSLFDITAWSHPL